ncbi:MAG: M48 family metalloprotease [Nitrososphaerota archaeon]|nr:M48 family metalloprotease [Nitrososphaerota archaeon]MDG6967795.1 M48 family metalloprotease [Nitrososphaerota archaeon]MDG6978482.1 M48 family metalloprotease [Nitrososphaerota archaeon]MDG7022266.1 M48 family metalloprotease [Nitrososphaerota archaeon]
MAESPVPDRVMSFQGGLTLPAVRGMAEFVKKHYLDPNLDALEGGSYTESWSSDQASVELGWGFSPPANAGQLEPLRGKSVALEISAASAAVRFQGLDPSDAAGARACTRVADDVEVVVDMFLSKAKTTSLYFIFSTGEDGSVRDAPAEVGGDALRRLLSGNMTNLYLLIMALSFGLFFVLGDYAIFAVLAIQLLSLFYSDRIALLVGKVRPTRERPLVTMVCVPVSAEMKGEVARFSKTIISDVSDRLESKVTREALAGSGAAEAIHGVLASAGIRSSAAEIKVVTRDVYGIVKGVADRFGLPVPRITIVNSVADNAAATGVSPSRSSITITAGSIEDLPDPELSAVVGHELGHILGRDSLILFAATFILYVGGFYVWLPVLISLGLFYYLLVFAVIFAIGKVLETRADTESAAKLGEPGTLASALSNIGFRQLYVERYSHRARFLDWLSFDPHPPMYFRVERLSKLAANGRKVGNTLLVSLRDCISGFLASL